MNHEDVTRKLINNYGWCTDSLDVWHRADYRCEYCCKDLLQSADDYFYGSHIDHIVPGAGDQLGNLALACKACNFIKSDKNLTDHDRNLARDELIARARDYIKQKRAHNDQRLAEVRKLLALLVTRLGSRPTRA